MTSKSRKPPVIPAVSYEAQVEQALAYHNHNVGATVKAGWPLEDVRAAALRIEAITRQHEEIEESCGQAAASETAAKYSGTTREHHNYR